MECNRFIDEKVGGEQTLEFYEHLGSCAGCRRDVEELEEIRELYRAASTERYPAGRPRLRKAGWRAWIPAAAAGIFMVVILFFIMGAPGRKDDGNGGTAFVRVPMEPWGGSDVRIGRAMDDLWGRLDDLERSVR